MRHPALGDAMDEMNLWLTPLILLPGGALLIMSTSARFNRESILSMEIIEAHRDAFKGDFPHTDHEHRRPR